MKKLILTTCKICNETRTSRGFSQHVIKTHGMQLADYIIQYEFNGIPPTCKCGCNTLVTIRGYAVMDYADDSINDVFYPPKPFDSWTISAPTWTWNPPVPYPTDDQRYSWDEPTKSWVI